MDLLEISADHAAPPEVFRPVDLVGLTACAAKVGVNKSTISRQLGKGLFKNWGTASSPLVSIAEVTAARSQDLDPAQQRAPAPRQRQDNGYAASRAAREEINRHLAEIELKEKLGEILDRRQVEDDLENFGRLLRERMRQRAQTLVMELEQLPTTMARAQRLIEADEQLFLDLSNELETLKDGGGG